MERFNTSRAPASSSVDLRVLEHYKERRERGGCVAPGEGRECSMGCEPNETGYRKCRSSHGACLARLQVKPSRRIFDYRQASAPLGLVLISAPVPMIADCYNLARDLKVRYSHVP